MKKRNLSLLAILAASSLALVACDDGETPDPDSGVMPMEDSGTGDPDSGTGDPDSGTMDPDSGVGPTPRGMDNPPTLGAQIDRMGRPAISTATIATFNGDEAARGTMKDMYNADADPSMWVANWSEEINFALGVYDGLDRDCGNQLGAGADPSDRYAFLAGVLADDQLYVNSGTGDTGVYLGVEAEALSIVPDGGSGGRRPADDVIDRSYSVLAAGILTGIDDTITTDDAAAMTDPDTFPFLAPPL